MAPYSPPVPADVQARLADRNVTVSYQAVPLGSYIKAPRAIEVAARDTPACSEPRPTSAHLVSFYGGGFVQPPDLAWLVVEKNVCEWIFGGIGDGGFYDADMAVFVDARTGDWSEPSASENPAVPHRHQAARPALLGAARHGCAQGGRRREPRPPSSLDAMGAQRAADARGEGRARARFSRQFDTDQDYVYGIFSRDESGGLGRDGLHKRHGEDAFEIGYWIRESRAGEGLATEASAALTKVAFEISGVDRVEIRVDPPNERSRKVPVKLGYVEEATLRRRLEPGQRDVVIYSIFADGFAGSPSASCRGGGLRVLGGRIL
jgi:RimJ/RimL family protein N-acetyltransferase